MSDLISREAAETLFRNARKALMEQSRKEHIKDFNTRDLMLLNAEQFIHLLPSVDPEQKSRECACCKHSNNGECAYTEECHKCMWESQYERQVEPERNPGKWVHMVGFWECDQCHAEYTGMPTCMGKVIYEYCPMCGAKMELEEGNEGKVDIQR